MPRQQRCRSNNLRHFFQNLPADLFCLCRQATTLVIGESHPPTPNLLSKNAILLHEVGNEVLLMLVHPTSD
jgi:hypothetical protein